MIDKTSTFEHIQQVQRNLMRVVHEFIDRGLRHDASKLRSPEADIFDAFGAKLAGLTYGSDDYRECLEAMGPALQHHYEYNDHHPEHGDGTVAWMDLIQVTEMLCDWHAATLRMDDGDLEKSIRINAERFGYGEEITRLLCNTARNFGWL